MRYCDRAEGQAGPEETAEFAEVPQNVVRERVRGIQLVEHGRSQVRNACHYTYVLYFGRPIFEGTPKRSLPARSPRPRICGIGDPRGPVGRVGAGERGSSPKGGGT